MKKSSNKLTILIIMIIIYLILKHYIPYGNYLLYPINLLVTFMHESGHSIAAFITGGSVKSIQINSDGSGFAMTSGGWRAIVVMGGYIGSAIFGNILLYIGLKKSKYSKNIIYILSGAMIFTGIFLFNSISSSIILFFMALLLFFLSKTIIFNSYILSFLGTASIIYIIEDFNGGPSSDLASFSKIFVILPSVIWMYIWLAIVLFITFLNLKKIFKK